MKIEEMKDTAANRDVNSGSAGSGVTAAAAIAALHGNKIAFHHTPLRKNHKNLVRRRREPEKWVYAC